MYRKLFLVEYETEEGALLSKVVYLCRWLVQIDP